ncbi:MAG: succinate dehydrogenase cytochrome b subunit [Myxococcales bacterium]|nr:succinate dehydrogenase cytochrome b subunit [Myxococcales bacterium]
MPQPIALKQNTVFVKTVMAISGVILLGYVIGHLLGNLKLYAGPEAINAYAAWLHSHPPLIWGTRLLLLGAVGAHISAAFRLWALSRRARPIQYQQKEYLATTYAARTMRWSGIIVLCFVVYHLAHLTLGQTAGLYRFDPHHVYNNIVYGFRVWWIALIYVIGNLALGLHLYHGAWSFLQTLGANHPRYNQARRFAAIALVTFIVAGNVSFPVMVMAGVIEPDTSATLTDRPSP